MNGRPIQRDLIVWKQRMGYVPEEPHLYADLSGFEYLVMVGQLRDLPTRATADRIDGLLRLLALHEERHVLISAYSKGMRQKVLLAAALLHNPDLLLLDEPFSGLDVGTALVLRSLIQELAGRGKVVLFSSHELETAERVSSRVVILHRGRVVADDSIDAQYPCRRRLCDARSPSHYRTVGDERHLQTGDRHRRTRLSKILPDEACHFC